MWALDTSRGCENTGRYQGDYKMSKICQPNALEIPTQAQKMAQQKGLHTGYQEQATCFMPGVSSTPCFMPGQPPLASCQVYGASSALIFMPSDYVHLMLDHVRHPYATDAKCPPSPTGYPHILLDPDASHPPARCQAPTHPPARCPVYPQHHRPTNILLEPRYRHYIPHPSNC
jgi:hypothetical protein